jgi:Holliday junction resolvase RusA-like endonuclease
MKNLLDFLENYDCDSDDDKQKNITIKKINVKEDILELWVQEV